MHLIVRHALFALIAIAIHLGVTVANMVKLAPVTAGMLGP